MIRPSMRGEYVRVIAVLTWTTFDEQISEVYSYNCHHCIGVLLLWSLDSIGVNSDM